MQNKFMTSELIRRKIERLKESIVHRKPKREEKRNIEKERE
jgi:hypothetical protein